MPDSLDATIDYRPEVPPPADFVRLFRSSGWTEAFEVPEDRLVSSLPHAWYGVCARLDGNVVGAGLVLSDGALHALIVDVIVLPELRGRGIGTEIMRRLVARCREAGIVQTQLFSARGKRQFYERLGFVARPDDGPGMELGGLA
jgi:GNAT superfamily N-acetyltransferase